MSKRKNSLILFDLDGVLVSDGNSDTNVGSEIIYIHPPLVERLVSDGYDVALLTHRTKNEAHQIMIAAGLEHLRAYSVNDIFFASLKKGNFLEVFTKGNKKSYVLKDVCQQFNIAARDIIFIDDRLHNVKDLSDAGIGLGVHVVSAVVSGDRLKSFDTDSLLALIKKFDSDQRLVENSGIIQLAAHMSSAETIIRTSIILRREISDYFGHLRDLIRCIRS